VKYHPLVRCVRTSKLFFPLVVFLCLATVLAACGSGTTTTTSKYGGNLKVGLDADVTTLDPLQSTSLYDRQVMLNIYDTLVRLEANNTIGPDLATS
jgi:peptide/nickel transport system substrate-binding protein